MARNKASAMGLALLVLFVGYFTGIKFAAPPGDSSAPPPGDSSAPAMRPLAAGATATEPTVLYYGEPIYTVQEAISKTLERFPAGYTPQLPVARLVSMHTYQTQWLSGTVDLDWPDETSPIWLVGIPGDGLTLKETLFVPGRGAGVIPDLTSVDGMYVAWDASTGDQIAAGSLISTSNESLFALSQLRSEPITIKPMVIEPPW